jgi:hypothetical protein
MEAIHLQRALRKDGEILVTGLPYKKGENIEMILLLNRPSKKPRLTARTLMESSLIGLWKNRKNIKDSSTYARQLRDQSQKRVVAKGSFSTPIS